MLTFYFRITILKMFVLPFASFYEKVFTNTKNVLEKTLISPL